MAKLDPKTIIAGSYDRVKLGTGVVGKLTTGLVALFSLLGVVAFGLRGQESALLAVAGSGVIVFLAFCAGVAIYAVKFPQMAALEGADLIKWRQMDMAAKTPEIIVEQSNTSPPPMIEARDG